MFCLLIVLIPGAAVKKINKLHDKSSVKSECAEQLEFTIILVHIVV